METRILTIYTFFFADKTSKNVLPTWEQIINSIRPDLLINKLTPREEANVRISVYMNVYPSIASEFVYAKISAIVQQLASSKALDNEANIKIIATALFIMNNNAKRIYSNALPWKIKYWYNTFLSKFIDVYNHITFTITNADLEKQIAFWYAPESLPFDEETGLPLFTIYTTTPPVVVPKTDTPSTPGGDTLITTGINAGLPINWTSDDVGKAVESYANQIETKSNEQLIQELSNLEIQLNDSNRSVYNGFDQIAFFQSFQHSDSGLVGGWSLRPGKEIKDVYNFFVSHSTDQIYPSWEYLQMLFANHNPPRESEAQKISNNILLMQYVYQHIVPVLMIGKMTVVANQLLTNNGLTDQNKTTLGTTLMIVYYDLGSFYGGGRLDPQYSQPWENQYIWNSFNNFWNYINDLPYRIINKELSLQVYNTTYSPDVNYQINPQTGYASITFYVTSPSVIEKNK